jgi:hypothetical protein
MMSLMMMLIRRFWRAIRRSWREPIAHDTKAKALDDRAGGMM